MSTLVFRTNFSVGFTAKLVYSATISLLLLFFLAIVVSNPLLAQAYVSVQVNNLTHPDLAPSFLNQPTAESDTSGFEYRSSSNSNVC